MGKSNRITALILSLVAITACEDRNYYQVSGYAQGGVYSIKYRGAKIRPGAVKTQVDSILNLIDCTLSGYNKKSDLSRFNSGDSIILSPMFAEVYEQSYRMWERTAGAFDVAGGPLFDIWGFGFTKGEMPGETEIRSTLKNCGTARLKGPEAINELIGKKICGDDFLKNPGTAPRLNFNAIAQGYSCDVIAQHLKTLGVTDMLVDIGEIYCCGVNPSGKGWGIGIDNPTDGNDAPGQDIREKFNSQGRSLGIVTSGNYRKFYVKNGKKYSHTIDPRTGYPVTHNLLSATVLAPTASGADALATYFMVIGEKESKDYIAAHPDIEACLITDEEVWKSWE